MKSLKVAAYVYREDEVLWAYVGRTKANLASKVIAGKSGFYRNGCIVQACGGPRLTDL